MSIGMGGDWDDNGDDDWEPLHIGMSSWGEGGEDDTMGQETDATLLAQCYLDSANKPIAAVDRLVDRLDRLLLVGNLYRARNLLDALDTDRLAPNVLTGVLSITYHAKGVVDHTGFLRRALHSLRHTWKLDENRLHRIEERFSHE